MWFYLPKTRAQFFRQQAPVYADDLFKKHRRNKWWNYWKIRESLWTFAFLLFSFRIGTIALVNMYDLWGFEAGLMIHHHEGKLIPPHARSSTKIPSHRHLTLVTIHRDGFIMVDGSPYRNNKLVLAFQERLRNDPLVVAALVIDREVRMEQLYPVLNALRKARIYRVVFITQDRTN